MKDLNAGGKIGFPIELKPVLTTSDQIYRTFIEAGTDDACIGIIAWMHTFSPAKMWIKGLKHLTKPMLHLHTQFNKEIPWSRIDMDFMNLNQSAHGGREFGFINTRLGIRRQGYHRILAGGRDAEACRRLGGCSGGGCRGSESNKLPASATTCGM